LRFYEASDSHKGFTSVSFEESLIYHTVELRCCQENKTRIKLLFHSGSVQAIVGFTQLQRRHDLSKRRVLCHLRTLQTHTGHFNRVWSDNTTCPPQARLQTTQWRGKSAL